MSWEDDNGSRRTYVDNAMNRRLGRVGMPLGSMVVSRGSSASSDRTYVDNAFNRSVGRAGLPFGSMVLSRGSSTSFSPSNSMNSSFGGVGMPLGPMIVSRGSRDCFPMGIERTYIDNIMNHNLGQVGLPLDSMEVLRNPTGLSRISDSERIERDAKIKLLEEVEKMIYKSLIADIKKSQVESIQSQESSRNSRFSEKLNPVFENSKKCNTEQKQMSLGLASISKTNRKGSPSTTPFTSGPETNNSTEVFRDSSVNSSSSSSIGSSYSNNPRTYSDNFMNQIRGCEEMPARSDPVSQSSEEPVSVKTYVDNGYNRRLGRVGMEHGSMVVSRNSEESNNFADNSLHRNSRRELLNTDAEEIRSKSSFLNSEKTYVDNAMNRSRGRAGMPLGSMCVTGSKTRSSSVKTYVDNDYNRRLGRAGMEHGSMVVSRKKDKTKDPEPDVDNSSNQHFLEMPARSDPVSQSSKEPLSVKTYVDNAYNRRLGRVGMEHGSMVVSRNSEESNHFADNSSHRNSRRELLNTDAEEIRSESSFLNSEKTNVDNAMNRSLGRAGMPLGSMCVTGSKTRSSSVKTYVDNDYNRRLGRAGMEHGSMVVSRKKDKTKDPELDVNSSKQQVRHPQDTNPEAIRVYKDNAYNRKLERVGLPVGSAVQPKSGTREERFYTDNQENRRLERVGLPLGSRPKSAFPRSKRTYADNYLNRKYDRVGMELGTKPVSRSKKTEWLIIVYHRFKENPVEDFDSPTLPSLSEEEEEEAKRRMSCLMNRLQIEREWHKMGNAKPVPETSDKLLHYNYTGPRIEFADLKLGKIIGSGGFGVVYSATYQDSIVAVKMLNNTGILRRDQIDEFMDEVNILSQLDHQFIVKFIGACITPPNLCIVMEYMQMSLSEALHVRRTDIADITDEDRLMMIMQTITGLEYLHGKGIAHCDIKTNNILITVNGKKEFTMAKLSDFGLSMIKDVIVRNIGTILYSSPEILRGESLNLRQMMMSDMYSYGLAVFEILCEEVPFRNLGIRELRKQVGWNNLYPNFPDKIHLNVHLKRQLFRCWDRTPENRPTAVKFLHTMNRVSCVYEIEE